jgi:hypothetical protein
MMRLDVCGRLARHDSLGVHDPNMYKIKNFRSGPIISNNVLRLPLPPSLLPWPPLITTGAGLASRTTTIVHLTHERSRGIFGGFDPCLDQGSRND